MTDDHATTAIIPQYVEATIEWLQTEAERRWDAEAFGDGDRYRDAASALNALVAERRRQEVDRRPLGGRCHGTLGSRPEWMSPDQYDPCRCRLEDGHDGPHWCEHLGSPDPRDNGLSIAPPETDQNGS